MPDDVVRRVFAFVDPFEALRHLPAVCGRFRDLVPGVQWDQISLVFDTGEGPLNLAGPLLRMPTDDEDAPRRPWRRSMQFWRRAIDRGLIGPQASLAVELRGPPEEEADGGPGMGLQVVLAHGRELLLAAHGLVGLLASAARASAASLVSVRLAVSNAWPAATFLNTLGVLNPDAFRDAGTTTEDIFLRAAIALAPCQRLESIDASLVYGTDGDQFVSAARPEARWSAAFEALGPSLRELYPPRTMALGPEQARGLAGAVPRLAALGATLAARGCGATLAAIGQLAHLEDLAIGSLPGEEAEAVVEETGPGFAALAAGPAGRSIACISAACFGRISLVGLEAIASLPRLAQLSLPLVELDARRAAAFARVPRLCSLLAFVQVRPESDGGASVFRALSFAIEGMLARPDPKLRFVAIVLAGRLGTSDSGGVEADVASEALADLIQVAGGTLSELRYDVYARRPPGARELAACAACPSLGRVTFSHGMEGEGDLVGYAPFASKLPPSLNLKINIGAASAGLAAYARSVLSGWFPGAELSAWAVEPGL